MWTGVRSRSYYSMTLWGVSEHWNGHEYFLKLMEVPALIFTECAVIYNVKDHRNIHWGGVSLIDKLGLHFSSMDCSKGTIRPGQDLNIKIL